MQFDSADEWEEWYRLSPIERWEESMKLWQQYLAQGGSLDPEPDSQSPFNFPELRGARPIDGGTGLRIYSGAEFSRDTDFAILADETNLARLGGALQELRAEVTFNSAQSGGGRSGILAAAKT